MDNENAKPTQKHSTDAIEENETEAMDFARSLIADCRYDDAFELLEKMEENDPENYEINYELGRLYYEMGNYNSAISNYEVVLEHHQSAIIYFNLGCAYEANNEIDKAIGAYLKALTINEKFPFAYKKLATLFMVRNDMESAREYFEDYLNLDIAEDEKENIRKILERI